MARIVVTDMFNHALPLIRYDTGDLAEIDINSATGEIICKNIIGKANDILYDSKGLPLLSDVIDESFWQFDNIEQWQIVQNSLSEYVVNLKYYNRNIYNDDEVKESLQSLLGKDAIINIRRVDEIPDIGYKKRYIICNVPVTDRISSINDNGDQ